MEKSAPPYEPSPPPPGMLPPPYSPHPPNTGGPNMYPPNTYSPNAYPPNTYPSSAYPPNTYPPNTYPPITYPPQAAAQPPSSNAVVITSGPPMVINFGENSQNMVCPHCHHSISTRVETKATTKTHLYALVLCMCLCWLCCCCPYCMDSCQGRNHYCPHCKAFLGTYIN